MKNAPGHSFTRTSRDTWRLCKAIVCAHCGAGTGAEDVVLTNFAYLRNGVSVRTHSNFLSCNYIFLVFRARQIHIDTNRLIGSVERAQVLPCYGLARRDCDRDTAERALADAHLQPRSVAALGGAPIMRSDRRCFGDGSF